MECSRFLSRWTHLEWKCSTTLPSPTTSQRRTRYQSRTWTKPSPAPTLKKTPVAAGSAPPPVSSPNPSTGEAEDRIKEIVLLLCVTGVDMIEHTTCRVCVKLCFTSFFYWKHTWKMFPLWTHNADFFPKVWLVNIFSFFCVLNDDFCTPLLYLSWFIQVYQGTCPLIATGGKKQHQLSGFN